MLNKIFKHRLLIFMALEECFWMVEKSEELEMLGFVQR